MESEAELIDNLTYSFTFRPKGGLTHSLKSLLLKYVQKQSFAVLVYEKEAEECHAHGQIFYEKPTKKQTIERYFERLIKKHCPDSIKKYAVKVKPAYNDDFVENYLLNNANKTGDKSEVAYKNMPSDTSVYYPSQEQQQQFIKKKQLKKIEYNQKITNLVKNYKKSKYKEYTRIESIIYFLHECSFIEHDIQIPKDAKCRRNLADTVYMTFIGKDATYADIISEWGVQDDDEDVPLQKLTTKNCNNAQLQHSEKDKKVVNHYDDYYIHIDKNSKNEVNEIIQLFKSDTPLYP